MNERHSLAALQKALRLFTILHLTATRRPEARLGRAQLAAACECSTKTIQRDIEGLQEASIPIDYDEVARTYTLPDKSWAFSLMVMTRTDALTLALAQGLLAQEPAALPFITQLHATLDKAAVGLSPELRLLRDAAAASLMEVHGAVRDYSKAPLTQLMQAAARKETVEMYYESRSSGTTKWRLADPYRIDRREGRYLEMQAWCHERRKVVTFALDRIHEVRVTGTRFTERPWNPSNVGVVGGLRGGEPVDLSIRFDRVLASYARDRTWPFEATLKEQPDGSVILQGEVQGMDGIVCEILSWRRHATVLGGEKLRARLVEEVRAMANNYAEIEKK